MMIGRILGFSVLCLTGLLAVACDNGDVESTTTLAPVSSSDAVPSTSTTLPAGSTSTTAPGVEVLQQLIDDWAAENDPVGVSAAALFPDGTLWQGTAGLADRDAGTPIRPEDRFEIASITKTFMSVLTLRLVEEGVVNLDDPVSAYLPDFPEANNISIRMLLGHRAGVHDPTPQLVSDLNGPPDPERLFTPAEIVAASAAGSPDFPPGSRHEYSNANYWVLATALEEATGIDVGSLLQMHVIDPLGLTDTLLFDSSLPDVEVVNAYKDLDLDGSEDPMGTRPLPGFVTPAWTAGAMISTTADLVHFLDGVFGGSIIDETSLEELTDTTNGGGGYGLGIYSASGAWGHDGGIAGYLSAVFHDPRSGVTVAVLTNRFGPDAPQADALAYRLLPLANSLVG